ncbi:D12 class N6 adenine-specific DNA methyltransferase [Paenibacillus curdlanolyticus YK9]|uniref:site-specific DNA-methyltransferase (adenine-specific) n=2 Tax=Paenibacillus curdlanolyticus TaxID=59840 RepID=E0I9D4_9BACL|nr:D12 class N6 adenine-specific DNA methyltransferase [Paenibacillus curdlanolyticus YK9]
MTKFVDHLLQFNNIAGATYIEPFAGGAGIAIELLLKNKVTNIIINDFDIAIFAMWYSILNHTNDFIQLILETPINMREWYKKKEIYLNKDELELLELGFATFFLNRTNNSGIITGGPIGGHDQSGKYKLDCRFNKAALIKKVSDISKMRHAISVYNYDAVVLINNVIKEKMDIQNTFIFFDPPYYKQGKNLYTNFFTHEDHKNLANEIIGLHDYHWITTYDFEEEIAELYKSCPGKTYFLQYSARKSRKEKEYLFYNNKTNIEPFDKVIFEEEF